MARNLRTCALQFLDHNHIMFALSSIDRNVKIYNEAGKCVDTLKGHKSKVFNIGVNYVRETFFTISKDCINLWNLKTFARIRTLYPKNLKTGASHKSLKFTFCQFSSDCDYLMTRFNVKNSSKIMAFF